MATAAKEKTLDDLFLETLKDVYSAEKQILRMLPRMAKAAGSDELRKAFETHRDETEGQVERLERVFEMIQKPARAKTCEAMQGLVEESKEILEDFKGSQALDAGLLASAQTVEHYEISRYGTLIAWAEQLEMDDAIDLLEQNLEEEKNADRLLTEIAEGDINEDASS